MRKEDRYVARLLPAARVRKGQAEVSNPFLGEFASGKDISIRVLGTDEAADAKQELDELRFEPTSLAARSRPDPKGRRNGTDELFDAALIEMQKGAMICHLHGDMWENAADRSLS